MKVGFYKSLTQGTSKKKKSLTQVLVTLASRDLKTFCATKVYTQWSHKGVKFAKRLICLLGAVIVFRISNGLTKPQQNLKNIYLLYSHTSTARYIYIYSQTPWRKAGACRQPIKLSYQHREGILWNGSFKPNLPVPIFIMHYDDFFVLYISIILWALFSFFFSLSKQTMLT